MNTHNRSAADGSTAAGARESLERLLGDHWGRAMWIDACRRAGVSPRHASSHDDLRRIARELMEVPGPAGMIGHTLHGQVALCERLGRTAA